MRIKLVLPVTLLVLVLSSGPALAVSGTKDTNVKAVVGQFILDVSGFMSPQASVTMTNSNNKLGSVTADDDGTFLFQKLPIKEGFSGFCLDAKDAQKLGESNACITFPPAKSSISKKDIFLPPTLKLSSKILTPNSKVIASGYTMPGADVLVHVGEGITLPATADEDGFYKVEIKNLPIGKYQVYSTAVYKGQNSEKPTKTIELRSISTAQLLRENLTDKVGDFLKTLLTYITRLFWLAIPIVILIIILLSKKLRDSIRKLVRKGEQEFSGGKKEEGKHLHHDWFIGY